MLVQSKLAKFGVAGALVGVLGAAGFAVVAACGFDPPPKHGGTGSLGAQPCVADAGSFPNPACDDSTNECIFPGCPIAASCGDPSTCMPLADNKGKDPQNFRLRRLLITAPKALKGPVIQNAVITKNIDLHAQECAEKGNGAFNWILTVDKTAGTARTGGAPLSKDPFKTGYCYYDHVTPTGVQVSPVDVKVTFDSTGNTFTSDPIPKLQVPIFLNGDPNDVIVLPISHVVLYKVTIGDDGNCIGSFETKAVDENCDEDPSSCVKWKTAGAIGGYITLEEADNIQVQELSASLCTLLTGTKDAATGKCPRNADGSFNLTPAQQGDFCSKSNQPGDCHDAFWLAATFAASAVTLDTSGSVPECKPGGSPIDAGSDSGPADAGTDAGDAAAD